MVANRVVVCSVIFAGGDHSIKSMDINFPTRLSHRYAERKSSEALPFFVPNAISMATFDVGTLF